jgi:hypothetical protein
MNEKHYQMNPIQFIFFQQLPLRYWCRFVNTKINAKQLAEKELQARGLDHKGDWVGFKKKQV